MAKTFTALITLLAIAAIMVPQFCCCQSLSISTTVEESVHSCCRSKAAASAPQGQSHKLQFKTDCQCSAHQNMAACTSEIAEYSAANEVMPVEFAFGDGLFLTVKTASGVTYRSKRGPPPDFESIRALNTYLINQVFRC